MRWYVDKLVSPKNNCVDGSQMITVPKLRLDPFDPFFSSHSFTHLFISDISKPLTISKMGNESEHYPGRYNRNDINLYIFMAFKASISSQIART